VDQAFKLRLARSYAILTLIDLRRAQTGDQGLGSAIEKRVLDRELQDFEAGADVPAGSMGTQHFKG
jgi:hypothetical protein